MAAAVRADARAGTTDVRPDSRSSRGRSTATSASPRRTTAPSRSTTGRRPTATPSTQVPVADPASTIAGASAVPVTRACARETLGSESRTAEDRCRPSVTPGAAVTRGPPGTTSCNAGRSRPPSGVPQLRHQRAPRETQRRHAGQTIDPRQRVAAREAIPARARSIGARDGTALIADASSLSARRCCLSASAQCRTRGR